MTIAAATAQRVAAQQDTTTMSILMGDDVDDNKTMTRQ